VALVAGGFEVVWLTAPVAGFGLLLLAGLAWELDLIALGEDLAASRGVALTKIRWLVFFATCFLEAVVVAVCGPIGFVGLMVPHMVRLAGVTRHRLLLPLSFLGGGMLLTACDTVARIVVAPAEMPVGVITALLGGPFFLWLLIRPAAARALDA
jgi:iron complex transport system permease protein